MKKVVYVILVVAALTVVYLLITAYMPFISGIAFETANDTSVAAYPSAQAGLRWTPIFLYTVPAVIGLVVIVLRLRRKD